MAEKKVYLKEEMIKRGKGYPDGSGAGQNVSEEEMNLLIEKAVKKWTEMNMNDTQIAFGIATMNVESGFNYKAKAHSNDPNKILTASGLGQFTDDTWKTAVGEYKKNPKWHLDRELSRQDLASQIAVMGAWIVKLDVRAKQIVEAKNPLFKEYEEVEIFYSIWHNGHNAHINVLKKYLEEEKKSYATACLLDTYNKVSAVPQKGVLQQRESKQSALSDKEIRKLINQKKEAKRLAFLHKELLKSLAEIKTGIDEAPDISEVPDIIGAYDNLRELIGKSINQTKDASPLPFVYNEVNKWLHKAKMVLAKKQVKTKSHNETNRESLKRIGDQVYRVEDGGRYRGHFNS